MKSLTECNNIINNIATIWVLNKKLIFSNTPDIDECDESITCGDHAVCENVDGGYSCSCKEGYHTSTGEAQFTPNNGTYCQGKSHYKTLCIIEVYKTYTIQLWIIKELHLSRNVPIFLYCQKKI